MERLKGDKKETSMTLAIGIAIFVIDTVFAIGSGWGIWGIILAVVLAVVSMLGMDSLDKLYLP